LKLAALTTKHQPMPMVLTSTAAMAGPIAYGDSSRIGAYLAAVVSPSRVPECVSPSTSSAWATVSTQVPIRLSVCPDT
jgi:hypothetical protein